MSTWDAAHKFRESSKSLTNTQLHPSYLPVDYAHESSSTVSSRANRRSLASIALEKTSNAFNNLAFLGTASSSSSGPAHLRSQPSTGSLSKPQPSPGGGGGDRTAPSPSVESSPGANDPSSESTAAAAAAASTSASPTPAGPDRSGSRSGSGGGRNSANSTLDPPRSSSPLKRASTDSLASLAGSQAPKPSARPLSIRRHTIQGNSNLSAPSTSGTANTSLSMSNNNGDNNNNGNPNNAKMHQTSSRLLRMTNDDKPFTRDFEDLFSTLMVSLKLETHRLRFTKFDHSFTAEEAINNLGSLKFSQSNRMPDPKDPSRIVTTTTTTTFSMAKEMARSVCQRFVDARFIESVDGRPTAQFPLKGALFQLTPKGIHVLQRFCQRNGITARHIMDVLDSPRNTMQLVVLERNNETDQLSQDRATIEVIFRRFAGQDGPNLKGNVSSSDSDSVSEYTNGIIGVKMAKERKIGDKTYQNSFTGKAAVDWLLDCCTTVTRRECFHIAEMFVKQGLITSFLEDKAYKQQDPEANIFQPTKYAIYGVSEHGQRVCGWIARDKGATNAYDGKAAPKDSNNARLTHILQDPALRLLFREFLRYSLCEENLSFYLDVSEFTATYRRQEKAGAFQKVDAVRETLASAYGLYNAFLAPGSPCELNIDHGLRNSLASRMTRAVGDDASMLKSLTEVVNLFEMAQVSVFKLMSSDSIPKFIRDPKYTVVLQEHDFDVNTSGRSYSPTPVTVPERSMSRSARS